MEEIVKDYIILFNGSPHIFEHFDISKDGTVTTETLCENRRRNPQNGYQLFLSKGRTTMIMLLIRKRLSLQMISLNNYLI